VKLNLHSPIGLHGVVLS